MPQSHGVSALKSQLGKPGLGLSHPDSQLSVVCLFSGFVLFLVSLLVLVSRLIPSYFRALEIGWIENVNQTHLKSLEMF